MLYVYPYDNLTICLHLGTVIEGVADDPEWVLGSRQDGPAAACFSHDLPLVHHFFNNLRLPF